MQPVALVWHPANRHPDESLFLELSEANIEMFRAWVGWASPCDWGLRQELLQEEAVRKERLMRMRASLAEEQRGNAERARRQDAARDRLYSLQVHTLQP